MKFCWKLEKEVLLHYDKLLHDMLNKIQECTSKFKKEVAFAQAHVNCP